MTYSMFGLGAETSNQLPPPAGTGSAEALQWAIDSSHRVLRLTDAWTPFDVKVPAQASFAWHPARFKVNPSGRRSGKTAIVKRKAVMRLLRKRGRWPAQVFLAAPTLDQARTIFWDEIKALVPRWWIAKINESRMLITTKWGAILKVVGMDRPQRIEGTPWDYCAIDEIADCYLRGTMVSTPTGPVPIESIRVGDKVHNAAGVGTVTETSVRRKSAIASVRLKQGCLVSSLNHRYLTARGWVAAGELKEGDHLVDQNEAMRAVWGGLQSPGPNALQQPANMRGEMPDGDRPGEAVAGTAADADVRAVRPALPARSAGAHPLRDQLRSELDGTAERPAAFGGRPGQTVGNRSAAGEPFNANEGVSETPERSSPIDGPSAGNPRGERAADAGTPAHTFGSVGRGLGGGTPREDGAAPEGAAHLLQDRFGEPVADGGGGDRRTITWAHSPEGVGRDEGSISDRGRVEVVEIHESASPAFREYSGGADSIDLFDLTVSGHPSFCVGDGWVVHNCRARCFSLNVRPALSTRGREGECDLTGVPDEVGRNQSEYEELYHRGMQWPLDPDLCTFHWSSADVLDAKEIEAARRSMDPLAFEQEYMGKFVSSGGKALPRFDVRYHTNHDDYCRYSPALPTDWTMDFGVGTKSASLLCQGYKGHVWVMDEISLLDGSTEAQAEALPARLSKLSISSANRLRIFGDAAGHGRNTAIGRSDYDVLGEKLTNLRIKPEWWELTAAPLVKDTLNAVRGRVATADNVVHLHIHTRCERLIEDCRKAPWPDRLQLKDFHYLAALRYYCFQEYGVGGPRGYTVGQNTNPNLQAGRA